MLEDLINHNNLLNMDVVKLIKQKFFYLD